MKVLDAFNRWFTSAAGVGQTFGVVALVVLSEITGLIHDNHGFWLLYWLTVYSAVTQPALAYVARQSGEQQALDSDKQEKILQHVETIVEHLDSRGQ